MNTTNPQFNEPPRIAINLGNRPLDVSSPILHLTDGLGYHDDGDYDIHELARRDSANGSSGANKRKTKPNLTKEALKRARKTKAGVAEAAASKTGEEDGKGNRSMWDFVNRGASASGGSGLGGNGRRDKREDARLDDDLDNMLDELDVPTRGRKSGGRGRASAGGRRSSAGRNGRDRHSTGGGGRRSVSRGSQPRRRRYGSSDRDDAPARRPGVYSEDEADAHNGNDEEMDFGGDDGGFDVEPEVPPAGAEEEVAKSDVADDEMDDAPATQPETQEHPAVTQDSQDSASPAEPSQEGAKPKRRLNRLAGRLSAAQARAKEAEAKRAEEKKRREEEELAKKEAAKKSGEKAGQNGKGGEGITLDVNSRSFQVSFLASRQARGPIIISQNSDYGILSC